MGMDSRKSSRSTFILERSRLDSLIAAKGQSFDHEALARLLTARDGWILSYDDQPWVRERYSDYDIWDIYYTSIAKSTTAKGERGTHDLLILSSDLSL